MNLKNNLDEKDPNRIIVLFDSKFGNTKNVATALARGLEAGGKIVDCESINNFNPYHILNYDVLGLGGPTHNFGLSKNMKEYLNQIKKIELKNKSAFVFETKIPTPFTGSAGKKIQKFLKRKQVRLLVPILTGFVLGKDPQLQSVCLPQMEEKGIEIAEMLNNFSFNHKEESK